ncbi:MAG: hypothetical protein NC095_07795 [Muribaculum sp.]|nr:hypothetical protein [Muribaculum sp.]
MYAPALDACRNDLFTSEDDLKKKYPADTVRKVLRVREMHNWMVSNPRSTDREFAAEVMSRHKVSKTTAYSDLAIVKQLLPVLSSASREFHRWRASEMLLQTFKMAELRKDVRTMERAASSYARIHKVEIEDELKIPWEKIVPQQFTATDDPSVLGIKPIPNLREKINSLLEKYRADSIDIDDVEYEEADLEFDSLFPDKVLGNDPDKIPEP